MSYILINKTLSDKTLTNIIGKLPFNKRDLEVIANFKLYKRDRSKFDKIKKEDSESEAKMNYHTERMSLYPIDNFYNYDEIYENFNGMTRVGYRVKNWKSSFPLEKGDIPISWNDGAIVGFMAKNIGSIPLEKYYSRFVNKSQNLSLKSEIQKFAENINNIGYTKFHVIDRIQIDKYKIGILHLINHRGFLPWTEINTEVKFFGVEMKIFPN